MSAPNVLPTDHVLPGTARVGGLRRRPTGAPPPLPRKLGWSGKLWLVLAGLFAIALVWLSPEDQPRAAMDAETAILRWFAALRTDWLTPPMRAVAALGTAWSVTILGGGLVLALIVFKRWRHLATFLVYLTTLSLIGTGVLLLTKRPRPYGVTIIGDWIGFSLPSFPVAILAACLMGIAYALVVPGRPRGVAKLVIAVLLVAVAFARLYLAVDHPSDVLWAVVLGAWRCRWLRSAGSPRTRPSRSRTGGARPRTSTSPEQGARRSGRRSRSSWGSPCWRSSRSGWRRPAARPRCG